MIPYVADVLYCILTDLLQVVIGMDVAASEFYEDKGKTYDLNFKEEVRVITTETNLSFLHIG